MVSSYRYLYSLRNIRRGIVEAPDQDAIEYNDGRLGMVGDEL